MRIRFSQMVGLSLAALAGLFVAADVAATEKDTKLTNLQGKVRMIDTDNSTITVDTKAGPRRLVVYNAETKFRYGHSGKGKESSAEQVHESNYISCAGTFDQKMRLVAKECVHRESR